MVCSCVHLSGMTDLTTMLINALYFSALFHQCIVLLHFISSLLLPAATSTTAIFPPLFKQKYQNLKIAQTSILSRALSDLSFRNLVILRNVELRRWLPLLPRLWAVTAELLEYSGNYTFYENWVFDLQTPVYTHKTFSKLCFYPRMGWLVPP